MRKTSSTLCESRLNSSSRYRISVSFRLSAARLQRTMSAMASTASRTTITVTISTVRNHSLSMLALTMLTGTRLSMVQFWMPVFS